MLIFRYSQCQHAGSGNFEAKGRTRRHHTSCNLSAVSPFALTFGKMTWYRSPPPWAFGIMGPGWNRYCTRCKRCGISSSHWHFGWWHLDGMEDVVQSLTWVWYPLSPLPLWHYMLLNDGCDLSVFLFRMNLSYRKWPMRNFIGWKVSMVAQGMECVM